MLLFLFAAIGLVACSVPEEAKQRDVVGLTRTIAALGPDIDPEEASRAARIAYDYPLQLRKEYGVTDSALIHNTKVNQGYRPRGLCWHWADDLEARLRQENFQTLQLHRAIANSDNLLIEHSTVIVSAIGDTMFEGVVLDPWRYGGYLFWAPTLEDTRYRWINRVEVFENKRKRAEAR
ncbi:hypothetical protein [Shimia sp.]|uniref:hypothetical protein n=1 Tax=Shimia sp. TaxID=1954381 RepID=UPI00329A4322